MESRWREHLAVLLTSAVVIVFLGAVAVRVWAALTEHAVPGWVAPVLIGGAALGAMTHVLFRDPWRDRRVAIGATGPRGFAEDFVRAVVPRSTHLGREDGTNRWRSGAVALAGVLGGLAQLVLGPRRGDGVLVTAAYGALLVALGLVIAVDVVVTVRIRGASGSSE